MMSEKGQGRLGSLGPRIGGSASHSRSGVAWTGTVWTSRKSLEQEAIDECDRLGPGGGTLASSRLTDVYPQPGSSSQVSDKRRWLVTSREAFEGTG